MKLLKFGLPIAVFAAGMVMTSLPSFGTPAYAKKEGGAKCTVCHVTMGKKDLNETGECYKKNNHSMETCKAKQ
jgi:hypothetical protein